MTPKILYYDNISSTISFDRIFYRHRSLLLHHSNKKQVNLQWNVSVTGLLYVWKKQFCELDIIHYCDAIMGTVASQITSLTIVYTTVYSDADQSKHQSSASLAFVWGIHRDRWIPRTKGQLRGKCFHLMTSSWSEKIKGSPISSI